MLVDVLRSFPYSPDGHSVVMLHEGRNATVRDELVDGLEKGGFVRRPAARRSPETAAHKAGAPENKAIPEPTAGKRRK